MPGVAGWDKMTVSGRRTPDVIFHAAARGAPGNPAASAALENRRDMRERVVMPSKPRNMPEQEHSIRARSDELFLEETPVSARSSKPFKAYLRETPAQPLSPAIKALFWLIGIVVGLLFLAALWRISQRHGGRPTARSAPAESAMSLEAGPSFADDRRVG